MINQINITVDEKDNISGQPNVLVDNINQLTNGYVKEIIFLSIDKTSQEKRNFYFIEAAKKLTHGGVITVKFLNPSLLAGKIKNNTISSQDFSSIVSQIKSCWMESEYMSTVSEMNGFHLLKHYYDDIYCISVIEKKNRNE